MKILRVDMSQQKVRMEAAPTAYEKFGGRSLIAHLLLDEIDPGCEPLGPGNKLIFTPGLLGGISGLSSAGRLSVGGKSPLTGGVKEANSGGMAGDKLGRLALKAVVVEGQPAADRLFLLHITAQGAQLLPADDLRGLGNYDTVARLQERYGDEVAIISIGPAGEMKLAGAGIAVTEDFTKQPGRQAARGGLGAVMGSKGLKAVIIDDTGAPPLPLADEDLFRRAARRFARELIESPKTGKEGSMHLYGTSAIMLPVNEIGALPTRNFSSGQFEAVQDICGPRLRETILARGGHIGVRCMAGCVIRCCNVFVDENGLPIVSTLQYETLVLLGSNLGIGNLDDIARLNYLCNDLGLDSIEMGAAIGVAMDAGLAPFGDAQAAMDFLRQIKEGTVLGRLLGNGAAVTGRVLGVKRIPVARGQGFPAYDPRGLKGNGVTYATSAMGADHTAGNAIGARNTVDPLGREGQIELSKKLQRIAAMLDMTGLCLFARPPVVADPQLMVDLLNGRFGWGWTVADLEQAEEDVLRTEREFNRRAGFTEVHDRLPEIFSREPLPPHNAVFDIPPEELAKATEGL
ncbi:MAG: aldehyde ferredoxin oxidoreductase [Anaerolineae bacterium]|nr:aldehyde ferredoxin oxidoreductase [Anaerolineae bacterium]